MVARNYTESNYARLLQQGAESGDEMGVGGDFITLTTPHKQISPMAPQLYVPSGVQYYDLNSMTE